MQRKYSIHFNSQESKQMLKCESNNMWMKDFLCLEGSAVAGKPWSLASSDTISPHTYSCLFPLTLLLLFKS